MYDDAAARGKQQAAMQQHPTHLTQSACIGRKDVHMWHTVGVCLRCSHTFVKANLPVSDHFVIKVAVPSKSGPIQSNWTDRLAYVSSSGSLHLSGRGTILENWGLVDMARHWGWGFRSGASPNAKLDLDDQTTLVHLPVLPPALLVLHPHLPHPLQQGPGT